MKFLLKLKLHNLFKKKKKFKEIIGLDSVLKKIKKNKLKLPKVKKWKHMD